MDGNLLEIVPTPSRTFLSTDKSKHSQKITKKDENNNNNNNNDDNNINVVLLNQTPSTIGNSLDIDTNVTMRKIDSVIKLAKLKIRVALDLPECNDLILHSFKQQIETGKFRST